MANKALGIMIDSREPEWVQKLSFGGIPTSVTMLEYGDALVACSDGEMLCVERKTPDDFLGSLASERLFVQISEMKTFFNRWSYLVITDGFQRGPHGNVITARESNYSWQALQGALLTVQELGVPVVTCAGDADYEDCLLRLAARDRRAEMLLVPPKWGRILSPGEAVIAALPGIGVERLGLIMDAAGGSPAWALCGLTDATSQIKGIAGNVKSKIRAALKLLDGEQLGILVDDNGNEILQTMKQGEQ